MARATIFLFLLVAFLGCNANKRQTISKTEAPSKTERAHETKEPSETEKVLRQIERQGQIWFTDPPDLYETDDGPRDATPVERESAETSVLGISWAPEAPKDLADLGRFQKLKSLLLLGDSVSDDALAHLTKLSALKALTIFHTLTFTGEGIRHLKALPNLAELTISTSENIESDALRHLVELKQLQSLRIESTPLDDDALKHIGKLGGLSRLWLSDSTSGQRCSTLKPLTGLSKLEHLYIGGFKLEADDYQDIVAFPELVRLRVERTPVGDMGMKEIGKLSQLRLLFVADEKISDEGLRPLSALRNLELLWLVPNRIDGSGLVHLHGLPKLRSVDVQSANSEAMEALRAAIPGCKVY